MKPFPSYVGVLYAALALAALTPTARAGDEHRDHSDGVRQELQALKAQMASLQQQVSDLQASNAALQTQLAAVQSNAALLLGPFVNVDPNPELGVIGPNITFKGANLHIVSGSGSTNDNGNPTGLGNLIIGYDEDPATVPSRPPLNPGDRGGSHNLVLGRYHRFTQAAFGGFVAGEINTISNQGVSVSGGAYNTASGQWASVSGGDSNTASAKFASGSGGAANTASGIEASVTGGAFNTASGIESSISGGYHNTASGGVASVSGGYGNTASGIESSVSGGGGWNAIGDAGNTASGQWASISGGQGNTAAGHATVVIGGLRITDNTDFSIAPQPPLP